MLKLITACVIVLLGSAIADSNLDLWIAAEEGDLGDLQDALVAGADPTWVNPEDNWGQWAAVHFASKNNDLAMVRLLLDNGVYVNEGTRSDSNPLKIASGNGNIELVNLLIERGASVNWKGIGRAALSSAAIRNKVMVMNALLEAGANIDSESNGRTALYFAAEHGHIDAVITLINHGADLDMQSWNGKKTALMIAIEERFANVVEALINANANLGLVNEYGWTALHFAVISIQPEIAQSLRKKGADANLTDNEGRTPRDLGYEQGLRMGELDSFLNLVDLSAISNSDLDLWIAAKEGALGNVEDALAAGADPEWVNPEDNRAQWTALHWASKNNNPGIVSLILDSGAYVDKRTDDHTNPLTIASRYGNIETVNVLIERGASVNWRGISFAALHSAAAHNHVTVMNALLEAGANTDVESNGRSPLYLASEWGHINAVIMLINYGADLDMQSWNGEKTALMIATEEGFTNVAEALIDANANLGLVNEYGLTALHFAAKKNQPEIAKLLLKKGADANLTDDQGRTARDIAYEQGLRMKELDSFSVRIALPAPTEHPVTTHHPAYFGQQSLTAGKANYACVLWARLWRNINTRFT